MKETLYTILRLFKPKYYNIVTGSLIACGISLLSKPLWLSLINWGIESSNENYKKINIPVLDEYDWILGLFTIIITLRWHTKNRLIDLKESNQAEPAYLKSNKKIFQSLEQLCQEIYPILIDNEYLFKTVGPNSGASTSEEPLRTDFTLWYKFRSESILPNNSKIKELLQLNSAIFNREFKELANKMILHIDAFEEHVKNDNYDYSEFQFPFEFKSMIESICYDSGIKSKTFLDKKNWVNKKLKKKNFSQWYFVGSSLLSPAKANDFDLVVYLNDEITEETQSTLKEIEFDFKLKFKTEIHLTLFITEEKSEYEKFLEFNHFKVAGHG